ncbi:hypothetical protein CLAFUW4_02737 [Fulvia fulva]|uniref:Uncharacterized protein n=1 Tax=Passalora fulva TaxID=5499 RepID=A0A9Q8L8Z3_PASFU|nr:uncharacterized protein CLAFUR5_02725 [Fulvia fulva]KAK4633795.1 hypothetical protein CLAFUR0_02734 [Fulvia fulva]UJO13131.1 hypothetical protein CLAFUR5_02725 [Fulvia fulva]WPV11276.1 hypothetical protein CLAFUW4_02737 [Fulvia fulva]
MASDALLNIILYTVYQGNVDTSIAEALLYENRLHSVVDSWHGDKAGVVVREGMCFASKSPGGAKITVEHNVGWYRDGIILSDSASDTRLYWIDPFKAWDSPPTFWGDLGWLCITMWSCSDPEEINHEQEARERQKIEAFFHERAELRRINGNTWAPDVRFENSNGARFKDTFWRYRPTEPSQPSSTASTAQLERKRRFVTLELEKAEVERQLLENEKKKIKLRNDLLQIEADIEQAEAS